ncbi:uncharacterized protein LOC126293302 isoform X2 [Schistocerca gregaria]|uniref:uncharacterized protein LOC126293302 isoform X2 n=1 Tax=Schistocerca gregaria TaxID=7010 RepID=UPI00211E2043|nr:uncharacterized protein LOC126293302 isoform X2 [Schistocerca gregaria]
MVQALTRCHCAAAHGHDDADVGKARRPDAESGRGSVATSAAGGGGGGGGGVAPLGLSLGTRCAAPISRLRVEKIEGGLLVAGVVVAANCQVALPAFGALFALAGCVLTAAAYRGPAAGELPAEYEARVSLTGSSRALGPACLAAGVAMLMAGAALCLLARRARHRQRRVAFHCPLHGDFYPLSPVAGLPGSLSGGGKPRYGMLCCRGPGGRRLWGAGAPMPTPQCPHSTLSSTRSSVSSAPASPCPAPTPFLVTSGSVSSGMLPSVGANLSPDQTFGSIKSLAAGREVASFPLSRTPSPPPPPPGADSAQADAATTEQPVLTVVAPAADGAVSPSPTTPPKGPRKSVSIVLPEDDDSGRG